MKCKKDKQQTDIAINVYDAYRLCAWFILAKAFQHYAQPTMLQKTITATTNHINISTLLHCSEMSDSGPSGASRKAADLNQVFRVLTELAGWTESVHTFVVFCWIAEQMAEGVLPNTLGHCVTLFS